MPGVRTNHRAHHSLKAEDPHRGRENGSTREGGGAVRQRRVGQASAMS
jgi:hypothetical protein